MSTDTETAPLPDQHEQQFAAGLRYHQQLRADNEVLTRQKDDLIVANRTLEAKIEQMQATIDAVRSEAKAGRVEAERVVDLARQERDEALRRIADRDALFAFLYRGLTEFMEPTPAEPTAAEVASILDHCDRCGREKGIGLACDVCYALKPPPEQTLSAEELDTIIAKPGPIVLTVRGHGPHVSTIGGQDAPRETAA